jgi:hypothetical protein
VPGSLVAGSMVLLRDESFVRAAPLDASGIIGVGVPGQREVTWFHGPGYVLLRGDAPGSTWIDVTVTTSSVDTLTTLQLVDLGAGERSLRVVRPSVMQTVLGGLTPPQELEPGKAQIVLSFVDVAGTPAQDLTIVPGPGMVVGYDRGDTYSNSVAATGTRGIAVIVNQPAEPFPGGFTGVSFRRQRGTFAGAVRLRTAQGAVTLATIVSPS